MTRRLMRFPTSSPPLVTSRRLALSDSKKAEALAASLETQFQPVHDKSEPSVTEVVNDAVRATLLLPQVSLS